MQVPDITRQALIFIGAGSGGLCRYWLSGLVQYWWGPTFPLGTFIVNVSGCLVMGFLATAWSGPVLVREEYRSAILIGVLGGYTTFSSFGRETITLLHDGDFWRAGLYVAGSVLLSLLGVLLGGALANRLYGIGAA